MVHYCTLSKITLQWGPRSGIPITNDNHISPEWVSYGVYIASIVEETIDSLHQQMDHVHSMENALYQQMLHVCSLPNAMYQQMHHVYLMENTLY